MKTRKLHYIITASLLIIGMFSFGKAIQQAEYINQALFASNTILGEYSSEPNLQEIKIDKNKREALYRYYSSYPYTEKPLGIYIMLSVVCFSLSFYLKERYNIFGVRVKTL